MDNDDVKSKFIDYADKVILNNKFSHAYLIELDNYESDLNYVYSFIKMILFSVPYSDLSKCDKNIINSIDHNDYPDIYVVSSDLSVIKKSQVVDLQKEFNNKSLLDNKRFYIIKEAEKLNPSSANTILKFLEEPEDDIVAFLLTDNLYHVLDTIISRCQVLSLKDNSCLNVYDDNIVDLLEFVVNPRNYFLKYNSFINSIFSDKKIIKKYLLEIENLIVLYLEGNIEKGFSDDLLSFFKNCNNDYLINIVSIIEEEIDKLNFNVNYKLWLDSLFSRFIGG